MNSAVRLRPNAVLSMLEATPLKRSPSLNERSEGDFNENSGDFNTAHIGCRLLRPENGGTSGGKRTARGGAEEGHDDPGSPGTRRSACGGCSPATDDRISSRHRI